jgi:hypothetical protein
MQQGSEPGMDGPTGRLVHPREVGRRGYPALCPDLAPLARVPLRLAPSLSTSRFLRWRHRYYGPVRLPTSARRMASALPRQRPPPETNPADPVGPLRFQRQPSRHDAVHDPGGASPSRIATAHMLPSCDGKNSASAIFHISGLTTAPYLAPVYASDPALPRRPQDSVPACPLRL